MPYSRIIQRDHTHSLVAFSCSMSIAFHRFIEMYKFKFIEYNQAQEQIL